MARWSHRGLRAWFWCGGGVLLLSREWGSHHGLQGCRWRRLVSALAAVKFPHQCLFGGWRWLLVWVAGWRRESDQVWRGHAGERRVNGASLVIGLGHIEQPARYVCITYFCIYFLTDTSLIRICRVSGPYSCWIHIWYGIWILPHISMRRRIILCNFLDHYWTWILE
jgi:hypothetical protein